MKLIIKTIPPTINKYIGRTNHWEYQKDKKEISESIRLQTIGSYDRDNPRVEIDIEKL